MPDLTTEYAWACETNREWFVNVPSSTGGMHTVTWGRLYEPNRVTEYGYTCTCKGFDIRGTCKHVKAEEARDQTPNKARCAWDGRWDGSDPEDDANPCCPDCAGPVFSYTYGA